MFTFTFLLPHTPFHTDHMAGGCQAAQQQQHGDHAHRQQKVRRKFPLLHVSLVANGTPTIDCKPAVIWKHAEMSRGRRVKHLQENTVSSSWRHRPRLQPMWRRPSSTQPGKYTTRSRRECSISTMRRTGLRSGLSTTPVPGAPRPGVRGEPRAAEAAVRGRGEASYLQYEAKRINQYQHTLFAFSKKCVDQKH